MTKRGISRTGRLPNRRETIAIGAYAAASLACPSILRAAPNSTRRLRMQSLNSGEKLSITYWADGHYIADALRATNWFMRDLYDGTVGSIDPKLLDLLHEIDLRTPSSGPLYVMSCFRSPKTNEMLAARPDGEGVDESSFHMRGMAVDVTQNFVDPGELYRAAKELGIGGVGFYPTDKPFVHIDVGPVDHWVWPDKGRPGRSTESS